MKLEEISKLIEKRKEYSDLYFALNNDPKIDITYKGKYGGSSFYHTEDIGIIVSMKSYCVIQLADIEAQLRELGIEVD